jgi:hypothetical protein
MSETLVVPYDIIADCFRNHTVVPFLGSAASFVGTPSDISLPGGAAFARSLAQKSSYPGAPTDALTKIAQYLEEIPADRTYLLSTVYEKFSEGIAPQYSSAVTDFLTKLPASVFPRLIVTTNYDVLVERVLEQRSLAYFALSHIMRGSKSGRLLCYRTIQAQLTASDVQTVRQVEEYLLEQEAAGTPPILLYKMHGTAWLRCSGTLLDSVVLTENDYIDFFAQDQLNRIPTKILELLRTSRLLFLGYALEDWNFRVLLRKLQSVQRRGTDSAQRHWACLLDSDPVEVKFWEKRGVNVYEQSLEVMLTKLLQYLV